nr:RpiB/LacA/LacB family sugar-phosphate isomerase [Liquorilactobacillus capillatus]
MKKIPNYSYVEVAVKITLLFNSNAVDFVITGYTSGQGMMIACNSARRLCVDTSLHLMMQRESKKIQKFSKN